MRSVAYTIVAGIMLIPAYQGFQGGDDWFGWSFVACSLFLFMAPGVLSTGIPHHEPEPSPFERWVGSPFFRSHAPAAIAPADPLPTAGATGAAPANRGR